MQCRKRQRLGGIWSTLWEQGPSHFLIAVIIIVVIDVIIVIMIFIINVIFNGMIDALMSLTLLPSLIPNTCHQRKLKCIIVTRTFWVNPWIALEVKLHLTQYIVC